MLTEAQQQMFWVIILSASIFLPLLVVAVRREWLTHKERLRWIYEHPIPKKWESDYYEKLDRATEFHALLDAVPQDEMVLKFWVPMGRWRAIAQSRVDKNKGKASV